MKLMLAPLLFLAGFQQPSPPASASIDTSWIYTTPLRWHWAPKGIDSRWTFATVAVLYPDGKYLEVQTVLMGSHEKKSPVNFSVGDGNLVRAGRWQRTGDGTMSIHSREVWWDDHIIKHVPRCADLRRQHCSAPDPMPGPYATESCQLQGKPSERLATRIRCERLSLVPLRVDLQMTELQGYVQIGLSAENPAPAKTPR